MKRIALILAVLIAYVAFAAGANAEAPYTTRAMGPGGRLQLTQDAYIPVAEVDLPISGAEDMFIARDGTIYIADTGNARILVLRDFAEVASYGKGVLKGPTGVCVDGEGTLYVADAKANAIVILDSDGNVRKQFGRPSEPLFGKSTEFLPRKIAVDVRQNLYVVSEGSVNGLVKMNLNGNFIGYFGANPATMSLKMILQRMFLTKEQLAQFIKSEAASPSNVAIDPDSMVFTVTAGTARTRAIRRFTVAGDNIFPDAYGSTTFRDIDVSNTGLVVAVDADGLVYEYDVKGMLLFVFGAKDRGEQRLGTLRNPTAIAYHDKDLYVLDKDKNAIVVYRATRFATLVHEGVRLYTEGFYREAKPYFEQVLKYNGAYRMAYQAIADAYFKEGDYAKAFVNYRYAEDRNGYSEAFWELRNNLLQRYLGSALLAMIGLGVVQSALARVDRRYGWFAPIRNGVRALARVRLVDDFVFMFRFIKQPADSFYYIKQKLRGSLAFAFLLYVWVIASRVLALYLTGFIFNRYPVPSAIRPQNEILYSALLIVLWNSANYLVSTISDGEGRVRDVIIGTAYSLFPYALFTLPIALLSNVLTLNEVFIYTFSIRLVDAWVALMLFLMVREIHNYSISETIRNILYTLFTMAVMLLTGYILYVLFNQLFDFVVTISREVRLRG